MTKQGYQNRRYAIEWHVNLWRVYGTDVALCKAALHHLLQVLDSDFYGEPRVPTDDPWIKKLEEYLDRLFAEPGGAMVSFQ